MKSKSMRFRWMSSLKKWVVNNLCCVIRKKNKKGQLESDAKDKCGGQTVDSANDLSTITSADPQSPHHAYLEREMAKLKLQDLHLVTPLGFGGFGRVILVQENNNSGETYAVKILSKQKIIASGQQEQVLNEKNIMAELRSDFIIRLHRTFKDEEYLYLLMKPCLGGELFTLLYKEKSFSNKATQFYIACIVEALSFMHSKGIIHRDLKPENILLDSKGYAKVIDFGVAKKLIPGKKTHTLCGSSAYMAPEIILNKGHDTAADLWSLGVLVFAMLSGCPLFADKDVNNIMQTCDNILKGIDDVVFPNEIENIAEDFIRKLCRTNPAKRLTVLETRIHGWFEKFHWEGLRNKTMEPPFLLTVESSVDTRNFSCEGFPEEADYPCADDVTSWDPDF